MADYTHTIDRWDDATGENLIEQIAAVGDYLVALETYRAAVKRWPKDKITLRNRARVIEQMLAGLAPEKQTGKYQEHYHQQATEPVEDNPKSCEHRKHITQSFSTSASCRAARHARSEVRLTLTLWSTRLRAMSA